MAGPSRHSMTWTCMLVLTAACSAVNPGPTPTAVPPTSTTQAATRTPRPTPTATPVPPTPTLDPSIALAERRVYKADGWSFQPVAGYKVEPFPLGFGQGLRVHDIKEKFLFYVIGTDDDSAFRSPHEVVVFFTDALLEGDPGDMYTTGNDQDVLVDNAPGVIVDIEGKMLGLPFTGQVFAVYLEPNRYVYIIGIARGDEGAQRWDETGEKVFTAMAYSVQFVR